MGVRMHAALAVHAFHRIVQCIAGMRWAGKRVCHMRDTHNAHRPTGTWKRRGWSGAKTVHFATMRWTTAWFGAMLGMGAAHAQFFQHLFQQDGFGSFFHHDQEAEAHNVGDATWFQDRVRHAKCSTYLCGDTLACVETPNECPCPYKEQKRCAVGDTYVCVQSQDCGRIQAMYLLQ